MGRCGDCRKAGPPWQRKEIGSEDRMMTLHFCSVLNDNVHENYGGCGSFKSKTTKSRPQIPQKPKQYFESVAAMRASKEKEATA